MVDEVQPSSNGVSDSEEHKDGDNEAIKMIIKTYENNTFITLH